MIARQDIVGVMLCGGEARRMHGVDKPLQLLDGQPLVAHVRERLAPQVQRVFISANRSLARYAEYAELVLPDAQPGLGPLAGVAAALEATRVVGARWLFVCPGDAPRLDRALVMRLGEALRSEQTDIAVPHDGVRAQHLFMLLRVAGAPVNGATTVDEYLASGARSVHGWLATQRVAIVPAADCADSFRNINTPGDLHDAQAQVMHTPSPTSEPL